MLKNSIKYYWEDPERITTVPLSTLDELLKIYPWSNVLRFLYWKRWLIEKNTSGTLESDSSDISPLYGELRYMLDNGPLKYDEDHFISVEQPEPKVEDEPIQENDETDEEKQSIIAEPNQIKEEDTSSLDEIHLPENEDSSLPKELPAEAISDEIDQESDAIESEDYPIEEIPQSIDHQEVEKDDLGDEDEMTIDPHFEKEHQIVDKDSIEEESNSDYNSEQFPDFPDKQVQEEIMEDKVEESTEIETQIAQSLTPEVTEKDSVDEEVPETEYSFEEELKELEGTFLADYESVIQNLDKDIAKLNELHLPESYDEMLLEEKEKTEIDELIESTSIETKEVEQVIKEETKVPLPKSQTQEKPKDIDKPSTMRNLQFDEELSGFTHWLLKFTKKDTLEDIHEEVESLTEELETPVSEEEVSVPTHNQELDDIDYTKEEEEVIDEDIWTEDDNEEAEEEVQVKKKKGKGKKKGKKKKKKKRKKGKKESKQDIDIGIVSEPLAKLFAAQGAIDEAISMYEKLILYRPEKKSKFAARIKKLKKTQKN